MYRRTISTNTALVPDSLRLVESRNSVYAATTDGRLIAIRLFDGALVELGAGYVSPVGVVPLTDGLRLAVAESEGAVLVVARDAADRNHARLLAQLSSRPSVSTSIRIPLRSFYFRTHHPTELCPRCCGVTWRAGTSRSTADWSAPAAWLSMPTDAPQWCCRCCPTDSGP